MLTRTSLLFRASQKNHTTHKPGELGASAKFSAIKDFLQTTVCRSAHLPGCALRGFQLKHRRDEELLPPAASKAPTLHTKSVTLLPARTHSCSKFPFPTPFPPPHLPPNPSAPYLFCAFHSHRPIAPTFPMLLRFFVGGITLILPRQFIYSHVIYFPSSSMSCFKKIKNFPSKNKKIGPENVKIQILDLSCQVILKI